MGGGKPANPSGTTLLLSLTRAAKLCDGNPAPLLVLGQCDLAKLAGEEYRGFWQRDQGQEQE